MYRGHWLKISSALNPKKNNNCCVTYRTEEYVDYVKTYGWTMNLVRQSTIVLFQKLNGCLIFPILRLALSTARAVRGRYSITSLLNNTYVKRSITIFWGYLFNLSLMHGSSKIWIEKSKTLTFLGKLNPRQKDKPTLATNWNVPANHKPQPTQNQRTMTQWQQDPSSAVAFQPTWGKISRLVQGSCWCVVRAIDGGFIQRCATQAKILWRMDSTTNLLSCEGWLRCCAGGRGWKTQNEKVSALLSCGGGRWVTQ